jgi:hypothetical protein
MTAAQWTESAGWHELTPKPNTLQISQADPFEHQDIKTVGSAAICNKSLWFWQGLAAVESKCQQHVVHERLQSILAHTSHIPVCI